MILNRARSLYLRAALRLGRKPRYESIRSLRDLAAELPFVVIDHDLEGIAGWLRPNERKALYALARWLPGPFLEIGPWVGLSTSIIAYAIKDSGNEKFFITSELNPKLPNYRPHDGGVGFFVPPESVEPCGVCSVEVFETSIKPVVMEDGGVLGRLKANLASKNLDSFVRVIEGDFSRVPDLTCSFVFSDTMHDPAEIQRNAPRLRRFLKPGTILACHDTDRKNEEELRRHIAFGECIQVDSLFVGQVIL